MSESPNAEPGTELVVPNPSALTDWSPTEFSAALANESAKRLALEEYIKSHLKDGVDYGTITFGNRESKPTLFKPGGEKVASLLKLRPSFKADADTLKMLGEVGTGVLAYICFLSTAAGEVVAEGRGSAGPEKADVNTRIKIAQKRAMVDAVLRVAALSDHFTQDLDDMDPPPAAAPRHTPKPAAPAPKMSSSGPPAPKAAPAPARKSTLTGTTMKFGKYKGKDIGELPTDYLEFLKRKPFDEADAKWGETNSVLNQLVAEVLESRQTAAAPRLPLPDHNIEDGAKVDRQIDQSREEAGPDERGCPEHGDFKNCPETCNSVPF